MNTIFLICLIGLGCAQFVSAQSTIRIRNADLPGGQEFVWTSDNVYLLEDMVFVKPGSKLHIEAGTVVKGSLGQGNQATGLVITRGAQIFAEGSREAPIIFTSIMDDLNGSLSKDDIGLWGGVVILGAARTNNPTPSGVRLVEGVNQIANPESLAEYGGDNDDDDSGVLRYVSIRHTGINVGDVNGNEIQGLTLAGVGRGTVIEYVESFASGDDGFEFFGGTADLRYLVSSFNTDDSFDWDEGFRGRGQYWIAVQADHPNEGYGRAFEMDGAIPDFSYEPFAIPVLSNVTVIGPGVARSGGDGSELMLFRENTGGKIYNSVFGWGAYSAVNVQSQDSEFDSRTRLTKGDLLLKNNIFYEFAAGNTTESMFPQNYVRDHVMDQDNANRFETPNLRGISRQPDQNLDPRPASGSPAWKGSAALEDDWFEPTTFVGAFGAENWLEGWTALDQLGYLNTEVITHDEIETSNPRGYLLHPNFPNPFNPTTTIRFHLPETTQISLKVYDASGRQVANLAEGSFRNGEHQIHFNAQNLASGIYLYELRTPNVRITEKMTLIK